MSLAAVSHVKTYGSIINGREDRADKGRTPCGLKRSKHEDIRKHPDRYVDAIQTIRSLTRSVDPPHSRRALSICACVTLSRAKQIENENIFKLILKADMIGRQ